MSQSFFNLFDTRTLNVDPTLFPGFDSSISIISESLTSLPPSSEVFIVSCFRFNMASPGNVPEIINITTSGVFWWSFKRFWVVCWTCWAIMSVSGLVRMSVARPENRTGEPKILSVWREASGLALWRRDIPVKRTLARAFLCLTILWWMWGRFPDTDLSTPTCSAVSTKGMTVLPMWIGLISLA